MKTYCLALAVSLFVCSASQAQYSHPRDREEKEPYKGSFFTGGSLSVSFSTGYFLLGGNPVFGYSLTRWADIGLVGNYTYSRYRDYEIPYDKLKQTIYGGGVFTRLFPVRFIFGQAQIEHNWIQLKYFYPNGGGTVKNRVSSNSVLVGAGYTTGRDPGGRNPYAYLALLFDVSKNENSPYTDNLGRSIPIVRAGFNVPLFTGRK
jgi:hypothetical protein